MVKLPSLKRLIIARLDLRKTDYLMREFLVLQKTGNVIVENTKELDIVE